MTDAQFLIALSGEIFVKSRRTRPRFRRMVIENLGLAIRRAAPGATLDDQGSRLMLSAPPDESEAAAEAASRVFGVRRVSAVREIPAGDLGEIADGVARVAAPAVAGRTFAVRVRRRQPQPWRVPDAEREIGSRLLADSAGVDLDHPQVMVRVEAYEDVLLVAERVWEGPGGVPLGSQDSALGLLSGGFDSAVAAWMLMRRGVPVHFVHFELACAQRDHALAVAHELWRHWGAGTEPLVWVVDFSTIRQALLDTVDSRYRQVLLKELMVTVADMVADRGNQLALVTGEAVGQVSSQTLRHLAVIDRAARRTVLRPLSGLDKDEIVALSRRIGTHDLSARAQEGCDLSTGRVAVAARDRDLERARGGLAAGLVDDALSRIGLVFLPEWVPGMDPVPVVAHAPGDATVISGSDQSRGEELLAVGGRGAARTATRLAAEGREVVLLEPPGRDRRPDPDTPPGYPPTPLSASA